MVPAQYEPSSGTFAVANIVYGLHTVSILAGLLTAGATIVGAFIFSAPSILAVILNYIFRGDARGTYLETHFSWQIRTFWFALVLTYLIGMPLAFFGVGFLILIVGLLVLGIWVAYRIIYGWVRLARRDAVSM